VEDIEIGVYGVEFGEEDIETKETFEGLS